MALKDAFLVLYGIARAKDTPIKDHIKLFRGAIQWNVSFARATQD
jgi:hypothetical protein